MRSDLLPALVPTPAPGELLRAALAASMSAAIRMVASRLDIAIEHLAVTATVDAQSMRLELVINAG